jgi:serine/threonine protein kinase
MSIELPHVGIVELTLVFAEATETQLYYTDHPEVVVKVFDLGCGRSDEISYGPYLGFNSEFLNYQHILGVEELRPYVPALYGGHIDYQKKHAFIAMEHLEGLDFQSWCDQAAKQGHPTEWLDEFRRAVYAALGIINLFHQHGIILIDFKPDNVIRLKDRAIKLVDLGALFTPRHRQQLNSYVYSATPENAEVLIDASNLQAGVPPNEASDVFSAGVALFEMAVGFSRLMIEEHSAGEMLSSPATYLFRDSQIKDVWKAFPHLKSLLPLVHTQLEERRLLFSEAWHLLRAYVAQRVSEWEGLPPEQQDQILLSTGTTFILEQLPPRLSWLAGPIAQATALRHSRLKDIVSLMRLLGNPAPDYVCEDILRNNCFVQYLRTLERPVEFVEQLNTWEVRLDGWSERWAVAAPVAYRQMADSAQYVFLRQTHRDEQGHRYLHVVDELEADEAGGSRLTLWQVCNDHFAWLGGQDNPRTRL